MEKASLETFSTIDSFVSLWKEESKLTLQVLHAVPQELWNRELVSGYRSLARLAWHIVQTPVEMLERVGIPIPGIGREAPVPSDLSQIARQYQLVAEAVANEIGSQWQDVTLGVTDEMYGETWTRSQTLRVLLFHMIHHRAQMTVLLRAGGAKAPGIYGPAKEEWATFGMPEPLI